MCRSHVVIVHGRYEQPILRGEKTIECRLSRARIAPFERVTGGDVLWFKRSGGDFFARAAAARAEFVELATRDDLDRLVKEHNAAIGGEAAYWASKRASKYASLIWLTCVRAIDQGPDYPRGTRHAWHVLPGRVSASR